MPDLIRDPRFRKNNDLGKNGTMDPGSSPG